MRAWAVLLLAATVLGAAAATAQPEGDCVDALSAGLHGLDKWHPPEFCGCAGVGWGAAGGRAVAAHRRHPPPSHRTHTHKLSPPPHHHPHSPSPPPPTAHTTLRRNSPCPPYTVDKSASGEGYEVRRYDRGYWAVTKIENSKFEIAYTRAAAVRRSGGGGWGWRQ